MVRFESLISRENKMAVVGLGYVGLPLAVHLAAHFEIVGFDLKADRIKELESGIDRTLEVTEAQLEQAQIHYTDNPEDLADCRLIIVAVPTPIDDYRIPDLGPLKGLEDICKKDHVLSMNPPSIREPRKRFVFRSWKRNPD